MYRKLKDYAKSMTASYRGLFDCLFDKETGVVTKLQEQLALSQEANERLLAQLDRVERTALRNSQYARRESLELHGVPVSFNDDLEGKVLSLINAIAPAAKVKSKDVQAVHRLQNKDNVIIKFISRKKKHNAIIKRSQLKRDDIKKEHDITGDIYLNESMCPEVKHLFYLCKRLKAVNKLSYYTFFNGKLKIKIQNDSEFLHIEHIGDLSNFTGMTRDDIEDLEEKRIMKRVQFQDDQ